MSSVTTTNGSPASHERLSGYAWLPVPSLLALIAALWVADPPTVHESRTVMLLLNFFFTCLASLLISLLTARSFLRSGQPGLLMFGCGALLWGTSSLAAATLIDSNVNPTITVHNLGALGAASCHVAGLAWPGRLIRRRRWLMGGFASALAVAAAIFWAVEASLTPTFFVQGHGGTPLRQAVLILSIAMFAGVAGRMIYKFRRQAGTFYYWYGLGLALVATALVGVSLLSVQGGALGWVNRLTQSLASVYLFIAAITAARETGSRTFAAIDEAFHQLALKPGFPSLASPTAVVRYGLAVATVVAAFGLRTALTAWVGPGMPIYITFFPAIMVAALFGGFGPGLLATLAVDATVAYWLLEPVGQATVASPVDRLGLVIFTGMGLFMSVFAELFRRNRDKAAAYDREAAVREGQARLATFAAATFEGIVESEGGQILDCNEQMARMLGYSVAELRGRTIASLIVPEDRERVASMVQQGREGLSEHGVLRKDGARLIVEAHGRPVSPGSPVRHTAVRDVTERHRAERALRENEERYRGFFDNLHEAVVVLDAVRDEHGDVVDWRCVASNDAHHRLFGKSRDAIIGSLLSQHVDSRAFEPIHARNCRVLATGERAAEEETTQGHRLAKVVFRIDSETLAVTALDVTERRRSEDALREVDRRRSEFLGVLSHELRNPLTPIRNSLFILDRAAPGGEQARRAVTVIRRQVDHLARLVDDLLDVTRVSWGKVRLQPTRLDLGELVRRTVDDHRTLLEGHQVALELPGEPVWVQGDATRLAQVLGNLLQNACKFTPRGGRISVSLRSEVPGRAVLEVADTGVGLDAETLGRLFEPFAQADRSLDRSRGGLGLGLALVKGMVELHGGVVSAQSAGIGMGACFVVTLPLDAKASVDGALPSAPRTAEPRHRVLLIEDNVDAADSLAEVLAIQGHQVVVAHDGDSGLVKARELRPEIILCDLGLPNGMDGYAVARALRGDSATASTFLVALSGYAQPLDRDRAQAAGFNAHLAKPPDLAALEKLIAEV